MTYDDLSDKDKRYYDKFCKIAEYKDVRNKDDVLGVVKHLSSPQMKSIPLIAFTIGIACGFFAADSLFSGGMPITLPIISIFFLWIGIQNLRNITTTIPMIAEIYIHEELPKRQQTSGKDQKQLDHQDAQNDQ